MTIFTLAEKSWVEKPRMGGARICHELDLDNPLG